MLPQPESMDSRPDLEGWEYRDTDDFKRAGQLHDKPLAELISPSATAGDADFELHRSIVDLHRTMRVRYQSMIHQVGRNIYPLIVARDNLPDSDRADIGRQGLGGTYQLYLANGETHSVRPTPRAYEMLKCLCHIPLGLFTILSPYFGNPKATSWFRPLSAYRDQVSEALQAFPHGSASLDERIRPWVEDFLHATDAYVGETLARRSVVLNDYQAYTARVRPLIRESMDLAAKLQVEAVTRAMLRWKEMLGPAQWKQLYVVIPAVWPVAEHSPRWQIFRSLMDPEEVDTHLLMGEGVADEEQARTLVGRIVADRLAGRLVFGIEDERGRRMTQCLSSPTDVVSDSAYKALREFGKEGPPKGCPFSAQRAETNRAGVPIR